MMHYMCVAEDASGPRNLTLSFADHSVSNGREGFNWFSLTDSDLLSFGNSHLQWNKHDANGTLQQSSTSHKSMHFL